MAEFFQAGASLSTSSILTPLQGASCAASAWTRRQSQRTTRSEAQLIEMRTKSRKRGVVIGVYDENDTPLELTVKYRGRKARNMKDGAAT